MEKMIRYSIVENKNQREIVLLKGFPCTWGKCAFCDYISDNDTNENEMVIFNHLVLQNITGCFGVLEVINSGSVFELPKQTLQEIKLIATKKNIRHLFFESYWSYRNRLKEMRDFFGIPITFKCGIETFDNQFRNKILKKGFLIHSPSEVKQYFDSICLLVGIEGQTKQMIKQDIDYLTQYFSHGCVNIFMNNQTTVKADESLINWFKENYQYLDLDPHYEILWNNTDFGVGGNL